jgi:hypothetical protein
MIVMIAVVSMAAACAREAKLTELQRVKAGALDLLILSPRDALRHGQDTFFIEFRNSTGSLADAGNVRATASMSMSGVPMLGTIDVKPTTVAGRYEADAELSMAGTWRLGVEWDGPAGKGSTSFSGSVQ